jgi:hypothetical protein
VRPIVRRGAASALLALPLFLAFVLPADAAGSASAQHRTAIQSLVRAAQAHHSITTYFATGAVLRVDNQQMRGTQAIARWWQTQYKAGLQVSLQSSIAVQGNRAAATIRFQTRTGACRTGCLEQGGWQFSGTRITSMTLKRMAKPSVPAPPRTVPSPPTAPPRTTPTIPT